MTETTLNAWGRPLAQDNVPVAKYLDHTWVTDFKVPIDPKHQPDPAKGWEPPERYWYCWGRSHKIASHKLGDQMGETDTANAISPQNTPAVAEGDPQYYPSDKSGSIVYYGLDGVCHMVANQVLCATGTSETEPLRVHEAKGYALSTFFFTTYGLNTEMWDDITAQHLQDMKMPGDDFIPIMEAIVPAKKQKYLLDIRRYTQKKIRKLRKKTASKQDYDYFGKLFEIGLGALASARLLLGKDVFNELFPFTDTIDVAWLHPEGPLSPSAAQALFISR